MATGALFGGTGLSGGWRPPVRRLAAFALRDTNVVVGAVIANNFLRAVSSVILTRLFVPEVFGIAGIIGSAAFVLAMLSDLGFQAFVVRHADAERPEFADTIWTIALLRSLVLTIALAALSWPIASLMNKPDLWPLLAVSSLTFLLEGTASLSLILALRRRMVLRLSLLEFAVAVAQLVAAVALAFVWRSYWAILVAMLLSTTFKSVMSYAMFRGSRHRLRFERKYAGELWRFARFVTGSSIMMMLVLQCDKLVLARVMPLDAFGFYMLACNLGLAPLAFTTAYASRVLYPAYAEVARDGSRDMRAFFYEKRRAVGALYMLAAGGLIGCAPLLVAVLYDERYADAGLYLRLIALTTLFAFSSSSANEVLTATGRIQVTLQASAIKLGWLAVAGPVGFVWGGAIGLVLAVGLMELPAMLLRWWQLGRYGLLRLGEEGAMLVVGGAGIALGLLLNALALPLV